MSKYEDGWPPPQMTKSGLVYIPHLRDWRVWEADLTEWPFVPLNYEPQTDEERASLGRLDRYDCESNDEYAQRKHMRDLARRYGKYFLEIPLEDEETHQPYHRYDRNGSAKAVEDVPKGRTLHQHYHEDAHETFMRDRAQDGWWDIEHLKGKIRPIPKTIEFDLSEFPEKATLAHVMHKAGLFESIGDARKNGWNKPIQSGLYLVGKQKRRVLVKEPRKEETFPKSGRQLVCYMTFESLTLGAPREELIFNRFEQFEDDPISDWAVWCRYWNGAGWDYQWVYQNSCHRRDILRRVGKAACMRVSVSKAGQIETYAVMAVSVNKLTRIGGLAVQIERGRAQIEKRPERKFLGCAVRYV